MLNFIAIKETEINNIQICKKINDKEFLIHIPEYIVIIKVIDNIDYMIIQKYYLSSEYYDYNSKLDLIFLKGSNSYNRSLYFSSFSNIRNNYKSKFMSNISTVGRPKFINDNYFFYFCERKLILYEIKNENINAEKYINLDYYDKYASIIDINENFYCLNDTRKILLLNKNNLEIAKTISMDNYNLGFLKIRK